MKNENKSKMKFTKMLALVSVLAAFGVTATSCMSADMIEGMMGDGPQTEVIEKQTLINSINVSGTVEGGSIVKVTSTLSQKVKTLKVDIGSYVKQGDILCVFDSSELEKEYEELKKSMDSSEAMKEKSKEISQRNLENAKNEKTIMLEQAQRAINDAVAARDRAYNQYNTLAVECGTLGTTADELYQSMINTEDEMQREMLNQQYQETLARKQSVEAEMNMLDSQLSSYDSAVQNANDSYSSIERSSDSTIQSLQDTIDMEVFNDDNTIVKQLETLEKKIEECTVKAPKAGMITALNVAEGSIPTTDSIMTIEDNKHLKITVQIKEADILKIKEGMKVIINTTATGEQEISGTVSRVVNIFSAADPYTEGSGGYTAEITIDEESTDLLIGMNAKAKIILEEVENVLAVPYDSITENDEGEPIVYIAREGEEGVYTAQSVKIEVGVESDYYTEIISSEIQEGDIVILSPMHMNEGEAIQISDSDEDMISD